MRDGAHGARSTVRRGGGHVGWGHLVESNGERLATGRRDGRPRMVYSDGIVPALGPLGRPGEPSLHASDAAGVVMFVSSARGPSTYAASQFYEPPLSIFGHRQGRPSVSAFRGETVTIHNLAIGFVGNGTI